MRERTKTTVLIILDGWGIADPKIAANPIKPINAPYYFGLLKNYANAELAASGEAVGLFKGQEGNSEAGHLNIGGGRVVKQDAVYISEAIKDGTFFKNPAFLHTIAKVKKEKKSLHLVGLLSNHNSAHSCPEHLFSLLELCRREKMDRVFLHLFTDGRDSGQHDALKHLKKLQTFLKGNEKISTMMGRYYGMDRNKVWDRTKIAFEALSAGKGRKVSSPEEAITVAYNSRETDEFISPTIITDKGKAIATIDDGDALIFFNLRSDRARQLAKVFVQPQFESANPGSFKRGKVYRDVHCVAMTDYGPDLPGIIVAFPSRDVYHSLVQTLCPHRQLYVSESEKFAHITYFLNGGYAQHFCDEQWVKIESDRVANFAIDPLMKVKEITDYTVNAIERNEYDFIAINIANADMIGHTGNVESGVIAVKAIDNALKNIVSAMQKYGARGLITADHGNIEEMVDIETGEVNSEHSVNPVPCIVIGSKEDYRSWKLRNGQKLSKGKLADVAPTILSIMGIQKPKEMTGKSLI